MSTEPMSLRAYARHRGVSLRAVQKALASGRIAAREDGRLDAEVADVNWSRNTAPRARPAPTPANKTTDNEIPPTASPQSARHHSDPPRRESVEPPRLESGLEYSK